MNKSKYLLGILASGLCLALTGCSEEQTQEPVATPSPAVTAGAQASEQRADPSASNGVTASSGTSATTGDGSAQVGTVESKLDDPPEKNPLTVMNLEPGTDRLFQNAPNEAERAKKREAYEARRKARLEAEQRRRNIESGQNVPLLDDGIRTITN